MTIQALHDVELAKIAEALKRLAATAQQPAEPQSSVEISRNAKSAVQWSVKVYAADPTDASALAQTPYDQLAERYGQNGEVAA